MLIELCFSSVLHNVTDGTWQWVQFCDIMDSLSVHESIATTTAQACAQGRAGPCTQMSTTQQDVTNVQALTLLGHFNVCVDIYIYIHT